MAINEKTMQEIKRKASLGIGLVKPTEDKQSIYDEARNKTTTEIKRKASKGIPLVNQTSSANNELYASLQPKQVETQNKQSNAQQYIDQLNDAQKKSALAGLDKSRNQALSNLQEEKAGIKPRYYDARNQEAAGNQQQARNFAEFMAARGGARSGANTQAEISQQGTLQSNLGSLNRQENTAFDNIGRRTTDVNNAYESDVQSANAGIEAQRMQAIISQMNADRGFGLQEAGLTGQYNGQQTLGGKQFDLQQSGQEFNQGMAGKQFDLQESGQEFNQGMAGKQFDLQQSGQEFNQNQAQEEFAYQQARDKIGDEKDKKIFDEDTRRYGLNYAIQQSQLNISRTNAATSRNNAANNFQLSKDKFTYQKEQDTLSAEQGGQQQSLSASDLNAYAKMIDSSNFFSEDQLTGKSSVDQQGLKRYIIGLNLPDEATDQLLLRYSLPVANSFNQGSR